jgi:hypothetical protein
MPGEELEGSFLLNIGFLFYHHWGQGLGNQAIRGSGERRIEDRREMEIFAGAREGWLNSTRNKKWGKGARVRGKERKSDFVQNYEDFKGFRAGVGQDDFCPKNGYRMRKTQEKLNGLKMGLFLA